MTAHATSPHDYRWPCNHVRRSPLRIDLNTKTSWLMRGSRGGDRGPDPPPPEKSQKYRVSQQYWSGSAENPKATKPAFNVGPSSARSRQRNAIELAFRWMARFLDSLSTHKKRCQSLAKLSGSAHGGLYRSCACTPEDCTWKLTIY